VHGLIVVVHHGVSRPLSAAPDRCVQRSAGWPGINRRPVPSLPAYGIVSA